MQFYGKKFMRKLHIDAVSQATTMQMDMENALLQIRKENSELQKQLISRRLGSIPEERDVA